MDELSPGARALLSAASSSDDPTSDDQERVRHAVLLRVGAIGIGAGTAALTTRTAAAKGLLSSFGSKIGAALVVVVGGSAAVGYVATRDEIEKAPVASAATFKPRAAAPVAAPSGEASPAAEALQIEDLPEERALPRRAAPVERALPHTGGRAEPEPKEEPAPAQVEAPDFFQEERQLINSADTALRGGRNGQALSLLAEHAARYPNGALAQEREGLRLIARCQGGAKQSTQAAAESFIERAPRSPVAPRVRSACGISR
jgi:hypothetical protein